MYDIYREMMLALVSENLVKVDVSLVKVNDVDDINDWLLPQTVFFVLFL